MFKKPNKCEKEEKDSKKEHMDTTFPYLDLLSDNSPKCYDEYSAEADILDSQIKKDNVNNIAIVAKYGAGKSSVINTFLEKYRNNKNGNIKNKYVRISLATFNNEKYKEIDIERSILQQLLYSCNKDSMPNSKIKRTNVTSIVKSCFKALVVSIFLGASVLFSLEIGGAWLFRDKDLALPFFSIAFFFLFVIIKYLFHFGIINKVKYKGIEADFNTENKDNIQIPQIASLINKFIDEVLYFFECTKINLVIFEDLDRLPTTEIFVKLRELNTIINSSGNSKGKVTFLYAVKDDLLKKEEERAKFFEFILPVIPIINPVTTRDKLRDKNELLKEMKNNRKMYFHDRFIKGISWYITDMRILNNTFNDYIRMYNLIFEDVLAKSNIMSNEKLFSICLYKNLYPFDYSLLEKNNGLIPLIINMEKLRSSYLNELNEDINKIRNHIDELNKEKFKSFDELKMFFIGQITSMKHGMGVSSNIIEATTITTFNDLNYSIIKHPIPSSVSYYSPQYSYVDLQGKKQILTPSGESYLDKENNIIEKCNNGTDKLNTKIEENNEKIQKYKTTSLSQIIDNYGIDFCFKDDIKEIYKNELKLKFIEEKEISFISSNIDSQLQYLRFLIINDYIDENYLTYITNYKAQKITPNDHNFIMSIQRQEGNFDYIPNNIDEIISLLDDDDFKNTSILNFNILANIDKIKKISKEEDGSEKYENIVNLLTKGSNKQIYNTIRTFLIKFNEDDCNTLLGHIISLRPTLFSEIISENVLTHEKCNLLFVNIINNASDYKSQNVDKKLGLFISEHDNYLILFQRVGDEEKVIKFIKEVNPCFKKLYNLVILKNIQQYIIDNNHYEISIENLEVIFSINSSDKENDFYNKNYSYIMSSDKKNVQDYINKNIQNYASKVLLNEKISCLKETQDDIENFLLNEELDIVTRNEIIKKSNIKIEDVSVFNEELYDALLKTKSIIPKWSTLLYIYEIANTDPVIDYLKHETSIKGDFVIEGGAEDTPLKLINEVLKKLSVVELKNLTKAIPEAFKLSDLQLESVSDVNLSVFIEAGKILYDDSDFNLIYNNLESLCVYLKIHSNLISEDFDKFFNLIISLSVEKDIANNIISKIIDCKEIELEIKKLLIKKCKEIIDIRGNENIYTKYFIDNKIEIPTVILWQFTKTTIVSKEYKKNMLIQSIENINITEYTSVKDFIKAFSKEENAIIDTDEFTFEKTYQNELLLEKLKDKGFLTYSKMRNKDEYTVKLNTPVIL